MSLATATTTTFRSLRTLRCDLYGREDCGRGRQFEMSLGGRVMPPVPTAPSKWFACEICREAEMPCDAEEFFLRIVAQDQGVAHGDTCEVGHVHKKGFAPW